MQQSWPTPLNLRFLPPIVSVAVILMSRCAFFRPTFASNVPAMPAAPAVSQPR